MRNIFRKKLKESVQYGEKGGTQLSRTVRAKDGSLELEIRDEKYRLRAVPRHHVLHGPLAPLKRYVKTMIVEHMMKCLPHILPDAQLAEPVREFARVCDLVIEAEDELEMKRQLKQGRDAMCMFLQEDDAWRFRWQYAMEKFDMKKVRLNKADKYFMRAKSFKVDK